MLAASLGLTSAYALEYEQFVYSVENGEAKLTGLTNAGKAAEMLSIPETINDYPSAGKFRRPPTWTFYNPIIA